MEIEDKKPLCSILDVDGVISGGKQFDLDITLPEDNRDVIYGVVKNCFKEPVSDAVVKLVEVVCDCGKEERRPIGHTFTDKEGEFVFGPLCPGKQYSLQIWVNDTKKIKICAKCHHEGKCLKGSKHDKCDCFLDEKKCDDKYYDEKKYEEKYYEEKKCEEKHHEDKKCDEKYHEDKKCEEKHYEEKKCDDNYYEDKKCDEKHCDEKKCNEKKCDEKYYEDKKCDEKHCEEKKCEEKHCDEKKCEERPYCERPHCYKPYYYKPCCDK